MTRSIKALGLALMAVFAMSAVIVSAAQAAKITLTDTEGEKVSTATFTGAATENEHVFTVEGSSVECENISFSGNMSDGQETVTVTPAYNDCNAFGFLGANVNTENCDYQMTPTEETSEGVFSGKIKVVCNTGAITITAGTCEAKVNSGTEITTGNKSTNITANNHMHLRLHNESSEVKTEKTKDGFGCPFNGTGTVNNATYNGTTTVKAYATATSHNDLNQVNVTISK